jgi:hypothetical protein
MEQGYPTREQIELWSTDLEKYMGTLAYPAFGPIYKQMLAMHTDLECEKTRSAVYFSAGQALEKQLVEARDLVRRMAAKLNEWEVEWVTSRGEQTDDIDADSAALLAEADAMIGKPKTLSETITSAAVTLGEAQVET